MAEAVVTRVPRATYRLQFSANFTFAEAERVVDYLAELGISHVYASPYLQARAGSTHGYDIIDHNALNTEIGDEETFGRLCQALAGRGIGQVLDFVPNHMGIGQADNAWWLDVLEWGEGSPYAEYFDIDWNPAKPELRGKVIVPFLGDHYGKVLADGALKLKFDAEQGTFSVWYYEHRFPVAPGYYAPILEGALQRLSEAAGADEAALAELRLAIAGFADLRKKARSTRHRSVRRAMAERLKSHLAALAGRSPGFGEAVDAVLDETNGVAGNAGSFERLHRLLEAQNYRLTYWLVAAEEINYRRFFQINDLAGVRIEVPAVFDHTHRLVLDLVARGVVHGLRIDHIDGLFDPRQYLERLQAKAREARAASDAGALVGPVGEGEDGPFYVVVEKILAPHEGLREDWPVAGTTGYDFLNRLNALFVDPGAEEGLTRLYNRFTGRSPSFHEIAYLARKLAMDQELASELRVLANEFNRLTETNWLTRDYTLVGIRQALREVVASFPVYRTYVDRKGALQTDRRDIDWAIAHGRRRSMRADNSVFDFIHALITTDLIQARKQRFNRREINRLAMKFQQYTGPVMAKGVEDTAFYRYNRLVSLNEVGGEPTRFGGSVQAFHYQTQETMRRWPHAMLSTSTHDTKRGEDVRARINVLSEVPLEWGRNVRRWAVLNRRFRSEVGDNPVPDPDDEYLFYQTLIGAWPAEFFGAAEIPTAAMDRFRLRMVAYMMKCVREGKSRSSWVNPNAEYEDGLATFVERTLDVSKRNPFIDDFRPFADRIAIVGVVNSLAQLTLKLTTPGVPDIYQGSELWDLNLVDPDNRQPVDFEQRARMLDEIRSAFDGEGKEAFARQALDQWTDGRVKLLLAWRLLGLRARVPELFWSGSYTPLDAEGGQAGALVCFARAHGDAAMLVVAPRLTAKLSPRPGEWPLGEMPWRDTYLDLPAELDLGGLRNLFTGQTLASLAEADSRRVPLGAILANLPVAVFASDPPPA
jgi:(1->4)-alpha-D-glucan 1-alpha-D-glucosylmutase